MGEDEAFLRALDEAFEDVAPALVYADWLDDRGDLRGGYVRLLLDLESGDTVGQWPAARARLRAVRTSLDRKWAERVGRLVLRRRRPLWSALGDLFLDQDTENDGTYPFVANRVEKSGYGPAAVRAALWDEVFPAVEWNLRHPAGEWTPFPDDWLEATILGPGPYPTAEEQSEVAGWIREAWAAVCNYLPPDFAREGLEPRPEDGAAEPRVAPDPRRKDDVGR